MTVGAIGLLVLGAALVHQRRALVAVRQAHAQLVGQHAADLIRWRDAAAAQTAAYARALQQIGAATHPDRATVEAHEAAQRALAFAWMPANVSADRRYGRQPS